MAFDPMQGFQVGQAIGKSKKSAYGDTAQYMSDLSAQRDKEKTKTSPFELMMLKQSFPSEKEQAQLKNIEAQTAWMNKMSLNPDQEGLVLDSVGKSGPRYINADARLKQASLLKQAADLPKLDRALGAVQSLKAQYERSLSPVSIKKGSNPFTGFIQKTAQGASQNIGSMSGTNPELNRYKANKEGFASLISKGGFMEAGVLTNEDIKRITNILPGEFSSKEEADISWQEIESILSSARKRFESASGMNGEAQETVQPETNNDPAGLFS